MGLDERMTKLGCELGSREASHAAKLDAAWEKAREFLAKSRFGERGGALCRQPQAHRKRPVGGDRALDRADRAGQRGAHVGEGLRRVDVQAVGQDVCHRAAVVPSARA